VNLDGTAAHLSTREARSRRRQIGLAFQYPEDQIFEQTVFREVAFGPRRLGLSKEDIAGRVSWALDAVGLDLNRFGERSPLTLSGGETRRVALAAILSLQPEVLILDEPTAGLDPRGRRSLLSRIASWQRETGATLIVVSHNLDELVRIVDRVVLLEGGSIIADGAVRDVLGDAAVLSLAQLRPPATVALLHRLQKRGWPVRTEALLPQEAAAEIARVYKAKEDA
jgi:energy-coupling factor transport system ATP-binding protein